MGKKEGSMQVGAYQAKQKKKQKEKERAKAKEDFENRMKNEIDIDKVVQEIEELNKLKKQGKLSHEKQHRLAQMQKYLSNNAPEMRAKQAERKEKSDAQLREEKLEKQRRVARFSIYFHEKDNPFGIPPPGEIQQYRWPDGTTRRDAPFQDVDSDDDEMVDKSAVPGFTRAALQKIRTDAQRAYEKQIQQQCGEDSDDDDVDKPSLLYIPPLPEDPYPHHVSAPLPPGPPPFDSIEMVEKTMEVFEQVRDARMRERQDRNRERRDAEKGAKGGSFKGKGKGLSSKDAGKGASSSSGSSGATGANTIPVGANAIPSVDPGSPSSALPRSLSGVKVGNGDISGSTGQGFDGLKADSNSAAAGMAGASSSSSLPGTAPTPELSAAMSFFQRAQKSRKVGLQGQIKVSAAGVENAEKRKAESEMNQLLRDIEDD